ncbi:MAG: alcohol dehydrogenase catalytic domain-containing protein [Lachnospiraceae bacterium]|jgi:L-iditol 2-dehydrogenase|nr:alcohol dehydrogenase catalytic domain-containing protein [Lachnospiraceae bacterium]
MEKKMKALVYKAAHVVEVDERDIPEPKDDEVQIKIKRVSICGSDLGAFRIESERFQTPLVLGHEFSGDITKVGKDVKGLKVGDRVSVNPMVTCNECKFCKAGQGNLCGNRRSLGTAINGRTDGAMREYMTVPDWMVVPLPDNVTYESGAMLEPCGVTLACAKRGHTEDEKSVLIYGAGPIGLLILKFLKALGVPKVIVSEPLKTRRDRAKENGADLVIDPVAEDVAEIVKGETEGYGADRVIIAAGVGNLINCSFKAVRNGGTIVLVALMHEMVTFDPMEIVGRGLNFIGSYMFTTEMNEAAQMISDGKLEVESLITSTFDLDDGQKAFEALDKPDNTEVKVQIKVND